MTAIECPIRIRVEIEDLDTGQETELSAQIPRDGTDIPAVVQNLARGVAMIHAPTTPYLPFREPIRDTARSRITPGDVIAYNTADSHS